MGLFRKFLFAGAVLSALGNPARPDPMSRQTHISRQDWGTTAQGEKVSLYTLKGTGGLQAEISTFGASVVSLSVPDTRGNSRDVVLGYANLSGYERPCCFGVFSGLIGPFANQLGVDFKIGGQSFHQTQPPPPGRSSIGHSGTIGFQKRVWSAVPLDGAEPSLAMTIKDADGLGGFPGNVTVTVTFTLKRDNTLVLDYRGTTDKPTVLNLTDHFYFSLNGEGNGEIGDERLTLFAGRYTPDIAAGIVHTVQGTVFDFTKPTRLGDRLALPEVGTGYNVNMVLDGVPGQLRPAARLDDPHSGIVMVVFTTQPAVLLWTDNDANVYAGKNGHTYRNHNAVALETQHYPDSPNHPDFPSTEVTPDKPLHEVTEYRFSVMR